MPRVYGTDGRFRVGSGQPGAPAASSGQANTLFPPPKPGAEQLSVLRLALFLKLYHQESAHFAKLNAGAR
jgi:hypothetical protein